MISPKPSITDRIEEFLVQGGSVTEFLRALSYYELVEMFYGFSIASAFEGFTVNKAPLSMELLTTIIHVENAFSILDLPATTNHEYRRKSLRLAVSLELGQRLGVVADYQCDGLCSEDQTWMQWAESNRWGVRRIA